MSGFAAKTPKTCLKPMIGIDIVDLNDPLLRPRTSRSLALISHSDDQAIDHPQIFWLFWAAKEATFKTLREVQSFAPKQIPIQLQKDGDKILFTSNDVNGEITVEDDHVLAVASTDGAPSFQHLVAREKTTNWSDLIRAKLKNSLNSKGLAASISRATNGLPLLNREPISITHHGDFAAVAYPNTAIRR